MRLVIYLVYYMVFNTIGEKIGEKIGENRNLKTKNISLIQRILIYIISFAIIISTIMLISNSLVLSVILCIEIFILAFIEGMFVAEDSEY